MPKVSAQEQRLYTEEIYTSIQIQQYHIKNNVTILDFQWFTSTLDSVTIVLF